jgi:hypothetical protein
MTPGTFKGEGAASNWTNLGKTLLALAGSEKRSNNWQAFA